MRQQAVDGSWCNLISITGILVILIGSSAILTQDSNDIVVVPIQRIIESVNKMEKTLSYLTDADGEALEMQRIAGAMDKERAILRSGTPMPGVGGVGVGSIFSWLSGLHRVQL